MVIISKKKYAAGDLISSEMSFVHVLSEKAKSKNCDGCISSSEEKELKNCSGCKHMFYCSQECQKKDWNSGHKYECQVYKHHYDKLHPDAKCRSLLRLYLVLKNNKKLATQKAEFQYNDKTVKEAFEDIKAHKEEDEKNQELMVMFFLYIKSYTECNIDFSRATMFELYCKCVHGSSEIASPTNTSLKSIGFAVYLGFSAIGHSCSPNICKIPNGLQMQVRASKEINIGDEICRNYVKLNQDKKSRQKELKEKYNIDCACERCSSNFDKEINYRRLKSLETQMSLSFGTCLPTNTGSPLQLQMAIQTGRELIPLFKKIYGYGMPVTFFLLQVFELHRQAPTHEMFLLLDDLVEYIGVSHGKDHDLYKKYKLLQNSSTFFREF